MTPHSALSTRLLLPLAIGFAGIATSLEAQTVGGEYRVLHRFDGIEENDQMGRAVSNAGDVNGDGIDDVILGVQYANPRYYFDSGAAYVFSGADGSLLHEWNGTYNDHFGNSVASAGDVNLDGYADVIVGDSNFDPYGIEWAGAAFVYSGLDGSLLHQWNGDSQDAHLGWAVDGAGDVNQDGYPDLIVGAYARRIGPDTYRGSAYVYSGLDGSVLHHWDGEHASARFGYAVAGTGDVDGDGVDDVAVGAWGDAEPGGPFQVGRAYVYSGATGLVIWEWAGDSEYAHHGFAVDAAGDLNGDGYADVLVGAQQLDHGTIIRAGATYAYSGADGSILHLWRGEADYDYHGRSLAGISDLDGDGVGDVLVGAYGADPGGIVNAGKAYAYSGADGHLIRTWSGTHEEGRLGWSVHDAGNIDPLGNPAVLIGEYGADPNGLEDSGSAYVHAFHPLLTASATEISQANGGKITLDMDFGAESAGAPYGILLSGTGTTPSTFRGAEIPLVQDTIFLRSAGGELPPMLDGGRGHLDAAGLGLATFTVPSGAPPGLVGTTRWFAAVTLDPITLDVDKVSVPVDLTLIP